MDVPNENTSPEDFALTGEAPTVPLPAIGRIVHYQMGEPEQILPCAALVTGYHPNNPERVILTVYTTNGSFITDAGPGGPDGRTPTKGCWNKPPMIPQ